MDSMNAAVNAVNDVLWSYVLIVVLIACGLYFTFATRFVQVRMLPEMLRLLTEGIGKQTEGHAISSFQAFCVSTASRVGVGNIAGVAIAIVTGGPGAVFWMWLIAFIGCATGFVESTLAQIYKLPRGNGKFHGGPAYYIKNALHQPGVAKLFALLISVTFGLVYVSVQANTIALSAQTIGIDPAITAAFLCIFTALVICGGMHRIAKVTEFLVPIMAGLYLLVALVIILLHLSEVPAMFALIFHDAFSPQAAVGGGLGTAMITGIKRGLFSNEAGEGSVPNAAATAAVTHPVKQGLVQSFGVYVDTWIVCSATAFIILLTGQYTIGGECTGIALAPHDPPFRLQLHRGQLLLRRDQHRLLRWEHAQIPRGLPRLRRAHGTLRQPRDAAARLEPRRPLHGPALPDEPLRHHAPRALRPPRAARLPRKTCPR